MAQFLKYAGTLCVVLLALPGCEKAFTPKGPYADQMIVYGILSNRSDTQYVRVYTTFDIPGYNPLVNDRDRVVRGAEVFISTAGVTTRFQETTVPRAEKDRYPEDLVAYHSYPFRLESGNTYHLSIVSREFGEVSSSVVVPKRGRVQFLNTYVLDGHGSNEEEIVVYGWIRELTYGVIARLYLVYEVLEGDVWIRHKEEVPSVVTRFDDGTKLISYPSLRRRQTRGVIKDKEINETFVFSRVGYYELVDDVLGRYPAGTARVTHALAIVTQVDQNLYTYSKVVNGFEDEYSIRTDAPDFTNIRGGRGVFGAMVEDSLMVDVIWR